MLFFYLKKIKKEITNGQLYGPPSYPSRTALIMKASHLT